jgi:hypothetical protein
VTFNEYFDDEVKGIPMSDPHIDIDEVEEIPINEPEIKTGQAKSTYDDFDAPPRARAGSYQVWGWERLPEMFSDLSRRFSLNMRQNSEDIFSDETKMRFRKAQREALLAFRSLIDDQLTRINAQEEIDEIRKSSGIKIEVEEDVN